MVFIGLLTGALGLHAQPGDKTVDMTKFTDTPTWAEEFDAPIDYTTKWRNHEWRGAGNNENSFPRTGGYWNRDMAEVKNGNLHIYTRYFAEGYKGGGPGYYSFGMDTSGLFEQTYGYFEIRCKLPKGSGQWAAFWLNSDAMAQDQTSGIPGAEIDIFESPYYQNGLLERNTVSGAVHYGGYGSMLQSEGVYTSRVLGDIYNDFHTYSLEWNAEEYIFYIDRREVARSSFGGVSQNPQYPILSVEVGGTGGVPDPGSWAGDIEEGKYPKEVPSEFVVDYVRVYQYKDLADS